MASLDLGISLHLGRMIPDVSWFACAVCSAVKVTINSGSEMCTLFSIPPRVRVPSGSIPCVILDGNAYIVRAYGRLIHSLRSEVATDSTSS